MRNSSKRNGICKTSYVNYAVDYLRKAGRAVSFLELRQELKLKKNEIIVLRRWFAKYSSQGVVSFIGCDKEQQYLWVATEKESRSKQEEEAYKLEMLIKQYVERDNIYCIKDARAIRKVIQENLEPKHFFRESA